MDRHQLAVACVYLGCKLQNSFISIDDTIIEYNKIKNPPNTMNNIKPVVPDLVKYEIEILNLLGFEIDIETPFAILTHYCEKQLVSNNKKDIDRLAFNILNDSYRRPLCVYFTPKTIALACLAISLYVNEDKYSFDSLSEFEKDFDKNEVISCVDHLLQLYENKLKM